MDGRKAKIAQALEAARKDLLATVAGLDEAGWQKRTSCDGWSVKDVLGHVAVGETGNITIIRRILTGEDVAVAGFDLDRYNQRQVEKRREKSTPELFADLAEARRQLLELLDEVNDEQLNKAGVRTTGEATTVEGVFYRLAEHEREHTQHIRDGLVR